MKNFKKILIILSLSFYLSALFIPQKEKEADAALLLTSAFVLGSLAVSAMGGVVAYNNREYIADFGGRISQSLTNDGIDVGEMFATNQYGLTNNVTTKIAEQIHAEKATYINRGMTEPYLVGSNSTDKTIIPLNADFLANYTIESYTELKIVVHVLEGTLNDFSLGTGTYGLPTYSNAGSSSYEIIHTNTSLIKNFKSNPFVTMFQHDTDAVISLSYYLIKAFEGFEPVQTVNEMQNYNTIEDYSGALNQVYNNSTVSVDYDRLEDIYTNSASQPMTIENLTSVVSGIESSIVDAGADTVGILTTIWNGISNIPTLIQSSSTAVLGGISSLSDDILTGLGTFTDNITRANDQLWTDAGVVWSGMTTAIDNMGLTITNSLTGTLTGLNDVATDLGALIGTIPGTITTGLTDTYTSVFTVPTNYFTTRTTAIQEILVPKLPQLPNKEVLFPSQYQEMEDWAGISADFSHYGIGEQMVIGNTAPNYYRRQIKLWISAILYFFTALFVIRKIAGVINK